MKPADSTAVLEPVSPNVRENTVSQKSLFSANPLFAGVAPAVLEKICRRIEIVTVAPDEIVFAEDEVGDCLYLIARGSIRISKQRRGGQDETLTILKANDYFGEMALIDNEKRSAQASAAEEAVLGRIDRETWDLLLRFAPHEVMANFIRSVMQRLRQNNQHFIKSDPVAPNDPEKTVCPKSLFSANPLFTGMAPAVLEKICQLIEIVSVAPNEIVFTEDEPGDCLYLIAQGSIRISKQSRGGQDETLTILKANDCFGEMALIDNEKRSARASAAEETILGRIDRETWGLFLRFAPHEVMANFTRSVIQRLRQNNQHFIEQISAISSALASSLPCG